MSHPLAFAQIAPIRRRVKDDPPRAGALLEFDLLVQS